MGFPQRKKLIQDYNINPKEISRVYLGTESALDAAKPTATYAVQMVEELLADSEKMANMFKIVFTMAEHAGDHGLSNFFADRQDAHKKHSWMLRATLK